VTAVLLFVWFILLTGFRAESLQIILVFWAKQKAVPIRRQQEILHSSVQVYRLGRQEFLLLAAKSLLLFCSS
jgi:hypothetical protein